MIVKPKFNYVYESSTKVYDSGDFYYDHIDTYTKINNNYKRAKQLINVFRNINTDPKTKVANAKKAKVLFAENISLYKLLLRDVNKIKYVRDSESTRMLKMMSNAATITTVMYAILDGDAKGAAPFVGGYAAMSGSADTSESDTMNETKSLKASINKSIYKCQKLMYKCDDIIVKYK